MAAPAATQHFHVSFGRIEQPFQYLDRRGLTGSIWTQQAKALASLDFQVQAVNGVNLVIIALPQITTRHCQFRVHGFEKYEWSWISIRYTEDAASFTH